MDQVYVLYHKDIPVVKFSIDGSGYVSKILGVSNESHIPLQFLENCESNRNDNFYNLQDKILRWIGGRHIPHSRENLASALKKLGVGSSDELAAKAFYMSLTDCYWIAAPGMERNWAGLNFFDNPFSDDVGKILLGNFTRISGKALDLHNPSGTSQGMLVKAWKIRGGKRILVKGGSGTEQQEPFNEVLASEIFRRLGIPHVEYGLFLQEHKHYCVCDNFLGHDEESVSAGELCADLMDFPSDFVSYKDFKERCAAMNVPYDEILAGRMFAVDFLIVNVDRHLNNFGFIRDAETLEWTRMAPVYDSGKAMFKDCTTYELGQIIENNGCFGSLRDFETSKPFDTDHERQLNFFPLADVFRGMDLSALDGIGVFYRETLGKSPYNERMTDERKDLLAKILELRLERLKKISLKHSMNCSFSLENKKRPSFKESCWSY